LKRSFWTKLRQIWIPKEFRLPEPEFTKEQLDLLEELIQMIGPKISRAASATKDERAKMVDFLVDLGTGIWRVRRKIDGLSRMPREIRDALYSLESMWMAMSTDGVEIMDHIGTTPSGSEAKVVENREIPGLTREQVIDAIKPTIILKGEIVQMAEVIMGRPPRTAVRTAAPVPPEHDDEPPAPVHEVETITMAPPLRKWNPDEEKTSVRVAETAAREKTTAARGEEVAARKEETDTREETTAAREEAAARVEEGPDANATPRAMPEPPPPEEREPGVTPNAEADDGQRLDPETAAIIEAEERQNAATTEPAVVAGTSGDGAPAVPLEEARSAGADTEPPTPVKRRRRKTSAETAADAATENGGTPDEKPAVPKKARAPAARKPRKKTSAPPEGSDVTPKEEA
jgi:hypothetical protein